MGYSTWTLQTDTTVDEYLTQVFGPGIEAYELVGAEIYAAARFEDDRTVFAVVILPRQAPCTDGHAKADGNARLGETFRRFTNDPNR